VKIPGHAKAVAAPLALAAAATIVEMTRPPFAYSGTGEAFGYLNLVALAIGFFLAADHAPLTTLPFAVAAWAVTPTLHDGPFEANIPRALIVLGWALGTIRHAIHWHGRPHPPSAHDHDEAEPATTGDPSGAAGGR